MTLIKIGNRVLLISFSLSGRSIFAPYYRKGYFEFCKMWVKLRKSKEIKYGDGRNFFLHLLAIASAVVLKSPTETLTGNKYWKWFSRAQCHLEVLIVLHKFYFVICCSSRMASKRRGRTSVKVKILQWFSTFKRSTRICEQLWLSVTSMINYVGVWLRRYENLDNYF